MQLKKKEKWINNVLWNILPPNVYFSQGKKKNHLSFAYLTQWMTVENNVEVTKNVQKYLHCCTDNASQQI